MVEWRAMRPIRARIDSAALRHNLGAARLRAPRSRICAVVKANAYGHGLARAARAFAAAEGLVLIELEAALELRRAGERRLQLDQRKKARLPGRIAVVAKLNTGLNRSEEHTSELQSHSDI